MPTTARRGPIEESFKFHKDFENFVHYHAVIGVASGGRDWIDKIWTLDSYILQFDSSSVSHSFSPSP